MRTAWHFVWRVLCLAGLTIFIGGRWLRYSPLSSTPFVDEALGTVMVQAAAWFLWPWVLITMFFTPVVVVTAVTVLVLRRRLFARDERGWHLAPLGLSLACFTALLFHYVFDANPAIALMGVSSLLAVALAHAVRVRLVGRTATITGTGVWIAFAGLWLALTHDFADRATVVAWTLALPPASALARGHVHRRDFAIAVLFALIPATSFAALLPVWLPRHGGVRVGDGNAYDFCEISEPPALLASIPACSAVADWRRGFEDCRRGYIARYDPVTLERTGEYRFWSDELLGRLEQLVCLEDEVHVSVQQTFYKGQRYDQTALYFSPAAPDDFTPIVAGRAVGSSLTYDAKRDAVFYTAEYNNKIVRLDRATGEKDDTVGNGLQREWRCPLAPHVRLPGSTMVNDASIHTGRDRLYVADWLHGRWIRALDLETLEPAERLGVFSGGSLGATVDEVRDRLLVASIWGLEVFDLATGKPIRRKRLGLISRPPVIDEARGVLYMSSTIDGKLRVLDLDDYSLVAQIPIGRGIRHPYLSKDETRLFASANRAHYYWPLAPGWAAWRRAD